MECYYLVEDYCRARLSGDFYKPTSEEKTEICQNPLKYEDCSRFQSYNLNIRDNQH